MWAKQTTNKQSPRNEPKALLCVRTAQCWTSLRFCIKISKSNFIFREIISFKLHFQNAWNRHEISELDDFSGFWTITANLIGGYFVAMLSESLSDSHEECVTRWSHRFGDSVFILEDCWSDVEASVCLIEKSLSLRNDIIFTQIFN